MISIIIDGADMAQYGTILYYTILYYTILYYTILYYTILYSTVLFYTTIGIPRWFEKTKSMENTWKMPIHVYGALVHGHKPRLFLCPDHVEQGVNITIEVRIIIIIIIIIQYSNPPNNNRCSSGH
jgi:hypothetical protein